MANHTPEEGKAAQGGLIGAVLLVVAGIGKLVINGIENNNQLIHDQADLKSTQGRIESLSGNRVSAFLHRKEISELKKTEEELKDKINKKKK